MYLNKHHSIPNLFVIGAMKSGTTSLHEYLNEHPEVFMSEVKEPGYFAKCVNYYPKDYEWYRLLFKDVKNEKIIGESSTHYTKLPTCDDVVQKLWEYNSEARLVYIMRHPIKRSISHYWHDVRCGDEHRGILAAIKNNPEYIDFSDYAYQLEPYITRFGKDKIYTLTFEDLIKSPDKELKDLFSWLGVDERFLVKVSREIHNALPVVFKKVKGRGVLYRFRCSALWNAFAPLIPNKITSYAAKMTEQDAVKSTDDEEQVYRMLTPLFSPKVKKLEKLLDKNFDVWGI